jgi:hypothetical protein
MKLQFLPDGSAACPLIRLYDFGTADAVRLRKLFDCLAGGSRADIALHEQEGIETVDGCQLNLRVGKQDIGTVQKGPFTFECDLTPARWADVASLTQPFCEAAGPNTYAWLDETGQIALLLSPDGKW